MVKVFNPLFTINITPAKPKREVKRSKTVSRRCLAVVILEDRIYKARIASSPVEESQEYIICPFTDKSLSLKGKTHVFLKHKDELGNNVCVIRDIIKAVSSPGCETQYDVLKEGLVLSGHIIKEHNKMYFEYEDLVAFSETTNKIINPIIKENTPLFDEHK